MMRQSGTSRAERGRMTAFSLVELLVVIAIIALLIGLLFPVITKVRLKANQTACASNLRQIGVAMQIYANANNGWVCPPGATGRGDRSLAYGLGTYWPMIMFGIPQGSPVPPLVTYEPQQPAVVRCPADDFAAAFEPVRPRADASFINNHSYVVNANLWLDDVKPIRFGTSELGGVSPAGFVVVAEKFAGSDSYNFSTRPERATPVVYGAVLLFNMHRKGGSNYLFLDQHVEALTDPTRVLHAADPWVY